MNHPWGEWKKKCALGLCAPDTQDALQEFTDTRFRRYLCRYAPAERIRDLMPSRENAWHLFETHLVTDPCRRGKSYKMWLFASASPPKHPSPDSIERSAAVLMRSVVREFLRREHSPARVQSFDQLTERGYETDLTQLLPQTLTPADETSWREQESIAAAAALQWWGKLSFRERIALLGRALGLPLSHPSITRVAGCKKTVLSETYRSLIIRMGESARATHREESHESQIRLTMIVLNTLTARVLTWAQHDKHCRDLISKEARLA